MNKISIYILRAIEITAIVMASCAVLTSGKCAITGNYPLAFYELAVYVIGIYLVLSVERWTEKKEMQKQICASLTTLAQIAAALCEDDKDDGSDDSR